MIRAQLEIAVKNHQIANSLMKAVEPDNQVPHLQITGQPEPGSLALDIRFDGTVETFIFTLGDMLACLQAAMETLNNIQTEDMDNVEGHQENQGQVESKRVVLSIHSLLLRRTKRRRNTI